MALRKKTLRRMSPTARKVARLAGEAESVARRLKNLIPELQQLDLESKALYNIRAYEVEGESLHPVTQEALIKEITGKEI